MAQSGEGGGGARVGVAVRAIVVKRFFIFFVEVEFFFSLRRQTEKHNKEKREREGRRSDCFPCFCFISLLSRFLFSFTTVRVERQDKALLSSLRERSRTRDVDRRERMGGADFDKAARLPSTPFDAVGGAFWHLVSRCFSPESLLFSWIRVPDGLSVIFSVPQRVQNDEKAPTLPTRRRICRFAFFCAAASSVSRSGRRLLASFSVFASAFSLCALALPLRPFDGLEDILGPARVWRTWLRRREEALVLFFAIERAAD